MSQEALDVLVMLSEVKFDVTGRLSRQGGRNSSMSPSWR
jgi:hypothetical protein